MSEARVGATLKRAGAAVPAGRAAPVDPAGLAVVLDIPPGFELERASLTVLAPGDDETIDLVPGAALATSEGETALPATKAAKWLTVDWGTRRPLTLLKLGVVETGRQGRLELAEGGPWFPPFPLSLITLGGDGQRLPGITGTRLMVTFLDLANPPQSALTKPQSLVVKAAARPVDLSAAIDPDAPFFQHALLLAPGEELVLRDELTRTLQRAWPDELVGGRITVTLRSSSPGRLRRLRLSLDTSRHLRAWSGGASSQTLSLMGDRDAITSVPVPADQPLQGVELTVRSSLRGEQVPLTPALPKGGFAHQLAPLRAAAQALATADEGVMLVGFDLLMSPVTRTLKGTLALHPDAQGRPADAPFKGAVIPLSLEEEGEAPWPARWLSLDLPKPVPLGKSVGWAVLTLTEGTALWHLDEAPGPDTSGSITPRGTSYRVDNGPWLPREVPLPGGKVLVSPWALVRPRLRAPAPPPPPTVALRWGTNRIDAPLDSRGRIALSARALEPLVPPGAALSPPLEIIVSSRAPGEVVLSDLEVSISRRDDYPLFEPLP
jgi:hypothetical protein